MAFIDDYKKEERIQGVLYDMSPSAGFDHANVNGNIYGKLYAQFENSLCRIFIENADLYVDETDAEYVIPDIMIVCDTKAFKKGTSKYYGVPKFVVETLSPSTSKKDKTVKKDLYARKGIREYWIIDYRGKSLEVYYLEDGGYQLMEVYVLEADEEHEEYNGKDRISLREFPHISLVLEDIFKGLD